MMREQKLVGALLLALGLSAMFAGVRSLAFGASAAGDGCKAICGVMMLVAQFFGSEAGNVVGGLLWLCLGVPFVLFGWALVRRGPRGT